MPPPPQGDRARIFFLRKDLLEEEETARSFFRNRKLPEHDDVANKNEDKGGEVNEDENK